MTTNKFRESYKAARKRQAEKAAVHFPTLVENRECDAVLLDEIDRLKAELQELRAELRSETSRLDRRISHMNVDQITEINCGVV